jgi:hypothetical protein
VKNARSLRTPIAAARHVRCIVLVARKYVVMGSREMSKRAHFWLRLAALVVIAAASWLPRGTTSATGWNGASAQSAELHTVHAAVAGR